MADQQSVNILSTTGFVATVDTSKDSSVWNKPGSINFVLFMTIGFSATLGFLAVLAVSIFFIRRWVLRRRAQRLAEAEASAVVLEPQKLYVVVHPGGTADVAHKTVEDHPRNFVLKSKPIELSMAVIGADDTIPASWHDDCRDCKSKIEPEAPKPVPYEAAIEVHPIQESAAPRIVPRRWPFSSGRASPPPEADSGPTNKSGSDEFPSSGNADRSHVPEVELSSRLETQSTIEHILTSRSIASEEYAEDLRLLTQRFRQ